MQIKEIETVKERFWSKVALTADPSRCWEWQAATLKKGYGTVTVQRKSFLAHRFSWFLHHGTHPDPNLFVIHSCDNRKCVNPSHLREGTHLDNMRDMVLRNRSSHYWAERSHCMRGHEYNEQNSYIYYWKTLRRRVCKACHIIKYKTRFKKYQNLPE